MPITRVNSARRRKDGRPERTCYACHKPIAVGTAYLWFQANRFARRLNWHDGCPTPPPSAMESNEKRSALMAAIEAAYEAVDGLDSDGGEEVLSELAEAVREVAEMYRESATNIEDGFQHPTEQSEELNGLADEVDGIADELDNVSLDVPDEDAVWSEVLGDVEDTEAARAEVQDDFDARWEEVVAEYVTAVREAIEEAESNTP